MAVVKNLLTVTLQLHVEKGVDTKGNPLIGKVDFRQVKVDAAEQDIYDVGELLAGLQQYPLQGIHLVEYNHLIDQG